MPKNCSYKTVRTVLHQNIRCKSYVMMECQVLFSKIYKIIAQQSQIGYALHFKQC